MPGVGVIENSKQIWGECDNVAAAFFERVAIFEGGGIYRMILQNFLIMSNW